MVAVQSATIVYVARNCDNTTLLSGKRVF